MKVAEMIDTDLGCWKSRVIDECLVPFDAQRIKAIPLCNTPQPDLLYWAFEKNGVYSVKSGYRALCEEARNEEASGSSSVLSTGFWSSIWKLKVPGKVKHFMWKACSDCLPTKTHLVKRRVLTNPFCHLCNRAEEDTHHALWGCEAIKQVWDRDFYWVNFEAFTGLVSRFGGATHDETENP